MAGPTTQDYIALSGAVYTTNRAMPTPPEGWDFLHDSHGKPITHANPASGVQAAAFQHQNTKDVVIAYQGFNPTNIGKDNRMVAAQLSKVGVLALGRTPEANEEALRFAVRVQASAQGNPLYVTGHSLGGHDAAYVQDRADASGGALKISGGASFGSPAIPKASSDKPNANFTNYIHKGDAIAHANRDEKDVGRKHYGGQRFRGLIGSHLMASYAAEAWPSHGKDQGEQRETAPTIKPAEKSSPPRIIAANFPNP